MKTNLAILFSAISFFSTAKSLALQEFESVVVEQKFNSSSSIVIDHEEIQSSRAKNLTNLLATQANIVITESNFQPFSVYLRGGDSSHVLILVDGVPFYDSASVQRTVNLNSLDLKSIQRIEVIKGSQSVLFGGQALSGVIKIDTIPKELKQSGQILVQGGTQKSATISAGGFAVIGENQGVAVRTSQSYRENISPVIDSSQIYPSRQNTGELAYIFKNSDFESVIKAQTSFDQTSIATTNPATFLPLDTNGLDTSTYQLALTGTFKAKTTPLKPTLYIGTQRSVRLYDQDAINGGGQATRQDYTGDLVTARFEILPVETQFFKILLGASLNQEKLSYKDTGILKSDDSTDFAGEFVKFDFTPSSEIQFEAGARADFKKSKNQIGANPLVSTYQVGVTLFQSLKAEYATGFKQPSLFQLFSNYGNPNLQPEQAISTSLSYEKNITQNLFFSLTYFDNTFSNLIVIQGAPPTLQYQNVSQSKTKGVEATSAFRIPEEHLFLSTTLGYQEPRDLDKDNWLVRRPLRTAAFKLRKEIEKINLGFEIIHNGDRRDSAGSGKYATLNSVTYVNATTEYAATEHVSVFVHGQNLTNQRYESTYGFFDEGLSATVGVEASF